MWYDRDDRAIDSFELNPKILDIRTTDLRFLRYNPPKKSVEKI